jgi:hypothetical protein
MNFISILCADYVPISFVEARDQAAKLTQIIAEHTSLDCSKELPGNICRIYAVTELDPEYPRIINIPPGCDYAGALCIQTCEAFLGVLASDYSGGGLNLTCEVQVSINTA